MKTTRMTMLILAALAVAVLVVAPTVGATEKAAKPAASAAPAASMSEEVTVTGTIVEADSGYSLKDAEGQSMILSEDGKGMELGNMVGKKVKVVGTLEEDKGVKTITATEFEEIK